MNLPTEMRRATRQRDILSFFGPFADPMRLSDLLAPQVSNRSRARGTEYFATGAVTHIERRDGIVHATVKGEQKYDV